MILSELEILCASLPRGVGMGVTCAIGLSTSPVNLPAASRFRDHLYHLLLSDINFRKKTCPLLPTSPSFSGVGILATSGFPLPSDQCPVTATLVAVKKILAKLSEWTANERLELGPITAALSIGTITSLNAPELATTYLPGVAIMHSQSEIEKILFDHVPSLLVLDESEIGVIATELFWRQTTSRHDVFEEVLSPDLDALKSQFEKIKNERIFRMK